MTPNLANSFTRLPGFLPLALLLNYPCPTKPVFNTKEVLSTDLPPYSTCPAQLGTIYRVR